MKVFFPLAGEGKRFKNAGYTLPKPLLPLGNRRLIQLAIGSVSGIGCYYHYLPSMDLAFHKELEGMLPPGCWHVIFAQTPGPLQTVLEAEKCLQDNEELLIMDCDSLRDSVELNNAIQTFRLSGADGGVTVMKSNDPMCSYVEFNSEWWVSEAREKDPFTSWSSTGPYWFRTTSSFLEAAKKANNANHTSINPVYNYLPGRTKAVPVSSFRHFGDPKAYEEARSEYARLDNSSTTL